MSIGRRLRIPTVRVGDGGARRATRMGSDGELAGGLATVAWKRLYRLKKASASNVIHISRCLAKAVLLEESIFIALRSCLCVLQVDSSVGWRGAVRSDGEFWSDAAADIDAAESASADRRAAD